eukprot:5294124-Pyramimonas_sp.AAC.1
MGANDAGCPASAGNCYVWARHGSFVYNPLVSVIQSAAMPDASALRAWIHDPSDPPAGVPAWYPPCIIIMIVTPCVGVGSGTF